MNFIKNVHQLFTSLLTWVSSGTDKLTDFNIGSAIRTLLESVALQLEEFYFDLEQAIRYAIDNAIYDAFGFERQSASEARGYVTVSFKEPLTSRILITKGTIFTNAPTAPTVYQFEATEDVFAPVGSISVLVPVKCKTKGLNTNLAAFEITTISASNGLIDKVTNEQGFTGGKDEETNTQRKMRFKEYIRSLQRGTREAIAYGVKTVLGVAGVWVDDSYIGFVRVYVHDAHGNLSDELKAEVDKTLDDYRAAGIEVEVLPIIKRVTDLKLHIIFTDDAAIQVYTEKLQTMLTGYLNNFSVSKNLYMSDIIAVIMEGYKDIIVNINIEKGQDTQIQNNELVVAGEVQVTGVHVTDWKV